MEMIHVVFDTSLLRKVPFGHPRFERLVNRVQQGFIKLYIPQIALEERRTQILEDYKNLAELIQSKFELLQEGQLGMFISGLPKHELLLSSRAAVDQNSRDVLKKYLSENKVIVLPITMDHANNAWGRYFEVKLPFNPEEKRENRRKDIPDSWILEAALEIKEKPGRHFVLIRDDKLEAALKDAGFEVWRDIDEMDAEIERATAVTPIRAGTPPPSSALVSLSQLRSADFENVDVIVLGINELLGSPNKTALFTHLESLGINREIAEHEARTMVLSGRLTDTGSHLLPTNQELAKQAVNDLVVQALLLKGLDDGH